MSDTLINIEQIMDRVPITVNHDSLAINAIKSLKKDGYILIVDALKLLGIFTERDLVELIANNIDLNGQKISQVMTKNLIYLKEYQNRDITSAIAIMRRHKIRHLPIVSSTNELIGIITYESIRSKITPSSLLKMRCVADVMNTQVIYGLKNLSLIETAKLLKQNRVSSIVIIEERKSDLLDRVLNIPIGIVTERDLVRFRLTEYNLAETEVSTLMSQPIISVKPHESLWQTHQLMLSQKIRRLVVVNESEELVGIVTQTNILQIFDPLEMSQVITVLNQQIENQTEELKQKNFQLTQAYKKLKKIELEQRSDLNHLNDSQNINNFILKNLKNLISPILKNNRILALNFSDAEQSAQESLQVIEKNAQKIIDLIELTSSQILHKRERGEK